MRYEHHNQLHHAQARTQTQIYGQIIHLEVCYNCTTPILKATFGVQIVIQAGEHLSKLNHLQGVKCWKAFAHLIICNQEFVSYQIGLPCQKIVHLNAKFRFDRKVCNHLSQFATNESCLEVMYVKHCKRGVLQQVEHCIGKTALFNPYI